MYNEVAVQKTLIEYKNEIWSLSSGSLQISGKEREIQAQLTYLRRAEGRGKQCAWRHRGRNDLVQ